MATPLERVESAQWYRVADLRPALRASVRIATHRYRGRTWHLLHDRFSNRQMRLNGTAYAFVGRLDGQRSLDEIWSAVVDSLGADAPTQDELIRMLEELTTGGFVQSGAAIDVPRLLQIERRRKRRARLAMANPLSFRVPLFDPTRLLDALLPWVGPVFSRTGFAAWLLLVLAAGVLALQHSSELMAEAGARFTSPGMLLTMWLAYPLVKGLHELAHGMAMRVNGAAVRETGITLLLLLPAPYVDASEASLFPDKRSRMLVDAAGIMAELGLAALALLVWLAVEPGRVSDAALAVMVIGGVSTVLFNGNPLLRFDGYHLLADALEMPNLGGRANAELVHLVQRYLLGSRESRSAAFDAGERIGLPLYGLAAGAYRIGLSVVILLWLLDVSPWLAVLALVWLLAALVAPARALWQGLVVRPRIARRALRAWTACAALAAGATLLLAVLPLPRSTLVQGVLWLPEQGTVRAAADGRVAEIHVRAGQAVRAGDALMRIESPDAAARVAALEARLDGAEAALGAAMLKSDAILARNVEQDRQRIAIDLAQARARVAALDVRAAADGTVALDPSGDLLGRDVSQGRVLAYVIDGARARVRAMVPQGDADDVFAHTRSVSVRPAGASGAAWTARLATQRSAASPTLPHAALGALGGGAAATDPGDAQGLRLLEPMFPVDLSLSGAPPEAVARVGERVWVRFEHPPAPLAPRIARALRQTLLRHAAES